MQDHEIKNILCRVSLQKYVISKVLVCVIGTIAVYCLGTFLYLAFELTQYPLVSDSGPGCGKFKRDYNLWIYASWAHNGIYLSSNAGEWNLLQLYGGGIFGFVCLYTRWLPGIVCTACLIFYLDFCFQLYNKIFCRCRKYVLGGQYQSTLYSVLSVYCHICTLFLHRFLHFVVFWNQEVRVWSIDIVFCG